MVVSNPATSPKSFVVPGSTQSKVRIFNTDYNAMQIQIEPAQLHDAPQLATLLTQLGYPTSAQQALQKIQEHQNPGYHLLVARDGHFAIGFVSLLVYTAIHHSNPIGRITAFCVDESVRSSGVGGQLLLAAESYFRTHGCFKVELTSNLKRAESHEFYRNRGYSVTNKHFIKILK